MTNDPERPDRQRLSAEDWEVAALEMLAEQGFTAVAVEPLARRLGVTKGSFYWHFKTRDALLNAVLARWEKSDNDALTQSLAEMPDPRAKLLELMHWASNDEQGLAIFSELLKVIDHPTVQPVMHQVSKRRLEYLASAFQTLGMKTEESINRARLCYAAYVGYMQLVKQLKLIQLDLPTYERYVDHVAQTLVPQGQ